MFLSFSEEGVETVPMVESDLKIRGKKKSSEASATNPAKSTFLLVFIDNSCTVDICTYFFDDDVASLLCYEFLF